MPKQSRLDDDALIYQPRKKQTEKEKLREMSFPDKLAYLWEYYKLQAFAILAVIALIIYFVYVILNPAIVPKFSAAMINNTIDETVLNKYSTDFAERLKLDPKKECVDFNTSFNLGVDDPYSMNITTALAARIANHEIDVMIAPESYFKSFTNAGYLGKLSDQLPTDVYSSLTDKFYITNTTDDKEKNVYGIYLSDTKLYKNNAYNEDPYILGIVLGSKHENNTVEFIRYLFNEK